MAHQFTVSDDATPRFRYRARRDTQDAFATGLLVAIVGYTLTICLFAWAAFYRGGDDPHGTITTALGILATTASAVTMALLIAAAVGFRGHPRRSAGMLVGIVVGLLLGLAFFLPTAHQAPQIGTSCACPPLIQQVGGGG